ncbi:MAG: hypothetical protein H0U52_17025 [Chloroflexi bacterium]|nr:hypothetical protein [Chloroflexota bacterium]
MKFPARMGISIASLIALVGTVVFAGAAGAAPTAVPPVAVSAPRAAALNELFTLTVSLPPEVAAVNGRVFVASGAAEVIGIAPLGQGTAFRPEGVKGGFAIAAFDLRATGGATELRVAVEPLQAGRLELRVAIDAAADTTGARLTPEETDRLVTVVVGGGKKVLSAPPIGGRHTPGKGPGKIREAHKDGKIDRQDLDIVRGAFISAQSRERACALDLADSDGDVNGDGCVDIVDVQAIKAAEGRAVEAPAVIPSTTAIGGRIAVTSGTLAGVPLRTFVVTSDLDTADAAPGNGACADSAGRCTLRAAMTEADYLGGEDRIEFNLVGVAPVTIQLSGRLPIITSRTGGVTIDGYSQPGSSPNTATYGSNAVPGVELRGNGTAAKEVAIYATSPNNVIRGLVIGNVWRGIFLDGVDAHDNLIVGNWVGFTRLQIPAGGQYGVVLNTASNRNVVGTPVLADRNVIGNWGAGIDLYGPGTDYNVVQNNLFCVSPSGATATCSTGIDHNFGPKNGLVGGTGSNERNVFGPSTLQGIEYSHGYNPTGPPGTDFSIKYQINNNRAIGNWVGFKADGSYAAAYRSAQNSSTADNGQAINVYDGANDNLVEGNYVASKYDGIQTMAPTAARNLIRNNIIGESPLGQAAPLGRWGIIVRWSSSWSVVEGNTIKNAAAGGIGLLNTNNAGQAQSPAYNIKLSRNLVSGTSGPAIDLFGIAGPDPNDPGDADTGANTVLNTPVVTSASSSSIRGTGIAGATVEVYLASRPAGGFGLPSQYLGGATVASNGTWTFNRASTIGEIVSAIQILPDQNTSEFAVNVAVQTGAPEAPAFTSASSTTFAVGTAGSFTVSASGTPVPAISRSGALPGGVTFTDNGNGTGTLSGTPAAGTEGAYPLTFTASNGVSPDASQAFTLQVNAAPAFTSASATTFVVGSAGTFNVTATGRPTAAIARTGTLPQGVTFVDNGNGTGTLSGTPAPGSDGTYPLTFTASNGVNPDASQSFTLTVDPAPVGGPIAADTYSRTLSGAWGTADTGGPWTITSSPSSFSTDGTSGRISLTAGATRMARLGSVSTVDTDMRVDVTIDRLPAGGNVFYYMVGRRVGIDTEYRAKVRVAANGAVFVQPTKAVANVLTVIGPEIQVPGLTAVAGQALAVRVQYVGSAPTLIRMRVWAAGGTEPSTWAASQSDSQAELQAPGAVGLRAYLASTTTNGPVLVSFDNLVVTP